MVDGKEAPRDVVRLVVGSGAGRDQADAAGDGAQRRDRAHRLDVRLAAVLLAKDLAAIDRRAARDGDAVLEEHAVELAALAMRAMSASIRKLMSVSQTASGCRQPVGGSPEG